MKKIILYIAILIFISSFANAELETCQDQVEINTNCKMISPSLVCTNYTYDIFNSNTGSKVKQGNLTNLNSTIYYFNFTEPGGDYIVKLCDNTTREVKVRTMINAILIVMGVFLIGAILVSIGFWFKNSFLVMTGGLWFILSSFFNTDKSFLVFGWSVILFNIVVGAFLVYQSIQMYNKKEPKEKRD